MVVLLAIDVNKTHSSQCYINNKNCETILMLFVLSSVAFPSAAANRQCHAVCVCVCVCEAPLPTPPKVAILKTKPAKRFARKRIDMTANTYQRQELFLIVTGGSVLFLRLIYLHPIRFMLKERQQPIEHNISILTLLIE